MALGGSFYATDAGDAERMSAMEAAYAGGIRHFDMAAGYGAGHQEELLGHFLAGRRDSAFVASKWHGDELGAAAMLAAVEASLRRLRELGFRKAMQQQGLSRYLQVVPPKAGERSSCNATVQVAVPGKSGIGRDRPGSGENSRDLSGTYGPDWRPRGRVPGESVATIQMAKKGRCTNCESPEAGRFHAEM
jgi:hypothetical protein